MRIRTVEEKDNPLVADIIRRAFIESSTAEERRKFVIKRFECRGDCDLCGNCSILHGRDPLELYEDYITGKRSSTKTVETQKDRYGRITGTATTTTRSGGKQSTTTYKDKYGRITGSGTTRNK